MMNVQKIEQYNKKRFIIAKNKIISTQTLRRKSLNCQLLVS
ncbi:hypothetical protein pb186bvf_012935 [Paramecium bursaria]